MSSIAGWARRLWSPRVGLISMPSPGPTVLQQWDSLFGTLHLEGLRTYSVQEYQDGREVRAALPRDGSITLADVRGKLPDMEAVLNLRPGSADARHVARPGDLLLFL